MFNQQYLLGLIDNHVEESLTLDFKAAGALERNDSKTKEISKDVSSFANSAGGSIIYGLKEDTSNKHLASQIDPIDRKKISKEWLEQIVQSSIQPRIEGITIHPIEIDNNKEKVVYIIEIPQSTTAHQAVDQRYYKRFNFNSVPMYDYEIRDVFNRAKHPTVTIEFEIKYRTTADKQTYKLHIYARNIGVVLSQYINCYIKFPKRCLTDGYDAFNNEIIEYFSDNTIRDLLDVDTRMVGNPIYKYGPSRYDPLLPRMRTKLDHEDIKLNHYFSDDENEIEWIVYADNAEPQTGRIKFSEITRVRI